MKPIPSDSIPVIEFLGLPGSGKTTLVQALLASADLEAHDLVSAILLERENFVRKTLAAGTRILPQKAGRAAQKYLALTISPSLAKLSQSWQSNCAQAQSPESRFIGHTLRLYAGLGQTSLNVFVEEGVLQRLYWANPHRNPSLAFLSSPRVRAVIFLNTKPDIAITRLRKRRSESGAWGVRRFRGQSEAQVFHNLERNYAFNVAGIDSLAHSLRVVELDGAASPYDLFQAAEREVRAIRD